VNFDGGRNDTFNIGVQSPEVTIGELAELLCRIVGRDLKIVAGETTPGSPYRRCPDMGKTIGVTGHEPAVSLEDGVTRTFEWYRAGVFEGGGVSAK
jgi:nucleoside-diphosphate-sugar epimerase